MEALLWGFLFVRLAFQEKALKREIMEISRGFAAPAFKLGGHRARTPPPWAAPCSGPRPFPRPHGSASDSSVRVASVSYGHPWAARRVSPRSWLKKRPRVRVSDCLSPYAKPKLQVATWIEGRGSNLF